MLSGAPFSRSTKIDVGEVAQNLPNHFFYRKPLKPHTHKHTVHATSIIPQLDIIAKLLRIKNTRTIGIKCRFVGTQLALDAALAIFPVIGEDLQKPNQTKVDVLFFLIENQQK